MSVAHHLRSSSITMTIGSKICIFCLVCKGIHNGHTTSNTRPFDVDITLIRQKPNFNNFPHHFHILFQCNFADQNIQIVSTYLFRCNVDGWKIHVVSTYFFDVILMVKNQVVSTYFFRCNFTGWKIQVVSTYFSWRNFAGRNIHVFPTYFFRQNFDGQKNPCCSHVLFWTKFRWAKLQHRFWLSYKVMETFEEVFLC